MARTTTPVTLEAVGIARDEMLAISRASDAWRYDPGSPDRWVQTETGEVVTAANPEGIPDDYEYLPPSEDAPDDHDVLVSDHGGRYVSTEPVEGDTAPDSVVDIEDAETSEEIGEALGLGAPVHEVVEPGDMVSVVVGLGGQTQAEVSFIDSDWVEVQTANGPLTVGIEEIRGVDVPPERLKSGEELLNDTVPDAEPSHLAGGVAAAIDDSRDDFHDIRNAITGADSQAEAVEIAADELDDDELAALIDEVERQQEIRREWDSVDEAGDLRFGQPILYDADRPKRGTVDDIDADGTVWLYDENRGMRSGINPDFGTIYADPEYDEDSEEVFTADEGRYGLASNPEVLENAFAATDDTKGSREAGIEGGNTTGDKMKVLQMPDGSRAFATPVDAYPGTTGVVKSRDEARTNNLNSPEVIEALGGTAAQTATTEGPDGREYIVKEGVPGQTASEYANRGGSASENVQEQASETMSAAYFVGNLDLHGGNAVVNTDTGELAIIDHDSAGYMSRGGFGPQNEVADTSRFTSGPRGIRAPDATEKIYEKAQQIRAGEVDLGVPDLSDHAEYANDAADKAVRQAYVDPTYDLPDDQVPAELQFPPTGIESLDDFDDPDDRPDDFYEVTFVDGNGDVVVGEVKDIRDGEEMVVENTEGYGVDTITDPNRVVDIL